MARNFSGSTDNLTNLAAPVTVAPLTISAWARPETLHEGVICQLAGDGSGGSGSQWVLQTRSDGDVWFRVRESGNIARISEFASYVANTWQHFCGVERSATNRRVFLDGTEGSDPGGSSVIPSGIDTTMIGERADGALNFDGDIGHVAIWNVALTNGEIASLAAGISPLKIRRDALVYYCPINGQSPELDVVGGLNMTVTGAVAVEEPPIPHSIVAP